MSKKLSALILKHKMLIVVAVALTIAVIIVSLPAFTASCSGSTCQGKDPNSTGCSSGAVNLQGPVYYVRHAGSTDLALSIRKSAACNARWVRLTIDSVDNNDGTGYTIKIQRQIYTPYGYANNGVYTKRIYAFGTGQYWTAMVKNTGDDRVRMCMGVYTSTDNLGCQDWVP